MSARAQTDGLARANGWQVSSRRGKSVYTRGLEVVTLLFDEDDTAVFSMTRTVPESALGKGWKGVVGNVLRHRWRTQEQEGEGQG